MKLAVLLIVLTAIQVQAHVLGQNSISLNMQQAKIEKVLASIEKKANFRFLYNYDLQELQNKVDINVQNTSLQETLTKIFQGTSLTYKLLNKNLVVVMSRDDEETQDIKISGTVTDEKGDALSGVSVTIKGTKSGTSTDASGKYSITVPENSTLVFTYIGFETQEAPVSGKTVLNIRMVGSNKQLDQIVVVGYGSVRKRDVTGAVSTVQAKDFNQGVVTAPDQLIQGRVAGLEVINNSGQPGAATTVRIRGNSSIRTGAGQPLYVIDGVPLDGRNARPALNMLSVGNTPDTDPLLFINPNDIASMVVLKDASATAIYGSRGAYGVIMITTKKGRPSSTPQLDINYSVGVANLMHKYNVLDASGYRAALKQYNLANGDYHADIDPQTSIIRNAVSQNMNAAISGGNENNTYRISLGYLDNEGIVLKSDLKKYMASITGQAKYLHQRFTIDYNVSVAHTTEHIAPVSNDAGFTGSLVGNALSWNPTQPLVTDSGYNQLGTGGLINPLALSDASDDKADITNVLAYIAPSVKIFKDLEYKFLYSINYQDGIRRAELASWLQLNNILGRGWASYGNNELITQLLSHTLTYNHRWGGLNFTALAGYEYQKFNYKGMAVSGQDFTSDLISYTNILQNASQSSLVTSSFDDPTSTLQSFFGRVSFNYKEKFLLTATLRADGSSKFGENNKYGYFPSFAGKWVITNEGFMNGSKAVSNLALRAGWGITGSQEFPPGAAQSQYKFNQGATQLINVANPDLKWETSKQFNVGVDFGFANNRVTGTVDYFHKNTTNLLFNTQVTLPGPATKYWVNLPANVYNSGVEASINAAIFRDQAFTWDIGVNAAFLHNDVENYNGPQILTGALSGPGFSGAYVQTVANGQPLNVFYTKKFEGFKDGSSQYANDGANFYTGNPNPTMLLGFSTTLGYKKWSLGINMHGSYGNKIYNNTSNAALNLANLGTKNVDAKFIGTGQSVTDGVTSSDRYIENGNYMKLANATLSYNIGNLGNAIKGARVFVTGQNLFTITKYTGFDPEVNTDKSYNGFSSLGIEYMAYPTARTFIFGVNFSL
jgi:iron complex outermembrane receptor protein